jgi:hypothetical protein
MNWPVSGRVAAPSSKATTSTYSFPVGGGAPIAIGSNAINNLEIEHAPEAKPDHITAPKSPDYSEMTGDGLQKTVVDAGAATRLQYDAEASGVLDAMIKKAVPYEQAQSQIKTRYPEFNPIDRASYDAAVQYAQKHPGYKDSLANAQRNVALDPIEKARNDFTQSAPGALIGNYANAVTAGAPVLLAGQEGNDFEAKSFEDHPVASWTGALTGGVVGAVGGGALVKGGVGALAAGESRLAPLAQQLLTKPGLVQGAVDVGMGANYGAATAGPGHRAEGAAIGAGLALGAEALGRGVIKPLVRRYRVRNEFGQPVEVEIPEGAAVPEGAEPIEGYIRAHIEQEGNNPFIPVPPDTPAEAGAAGAASGTKAGDDLPLNPPKNHTTPDEMVANAERVDPADAAPNGTSAAKDGKVANINLDHIETAEDISRVLKETEDAFPMDKARRGKISHEETEGLAADLKMTPEQLLSRREGQALNAEQALAARQILAKSAEELSDLAEKAATNGGAEDLLNFQKALLKHAAIQEQVTGAAAEAGRALASFRIAAKSSAVKADVLQSVMEGGSSLQDIAKKLYELKGSPADFNAFARNAWQPTKWDKALEYYYSAMLSGPTTHAANIIGNILTNITQPLEYGLASAMGKVRQGGNKLLGRATEDRVLMSEVGARAVGMMQGVREGLASGWKAFTTGETNDAVTKLEITRHEAIKGTKGKIIRAPLRALTAEDEFFKAIARRADIAAQAVKKARGEGLRGAAAKERIVELTANPTDKMMAQAQDYARYMTFQNKLGKHGTKLMAAVNDLPLLKLFIPFIRTPANIFKYAGKRTPFGLLSKNVRADLAAGGAARDLAVARMTIGTGLGMTFYEMAQAGYITGNGPADPNAKRLLQAQGWQPFSIKIGDTYYSYQRLDPFATIIGTVADLAEKQSDMTDAQLDKSAALLIGGFVANIENKSFMTGISNAFAAIEAARKGQPEEGIRMLQQTFAGIAVPAIVAQANQSVDPVQRSVGQDSFTTGLVDSVENRIPGLSDNNAPMRDVLGSEVPRDAFGPNWLSPLKKSTDRKDEVVTAIQQSGASLGKLARRLDINGDGVKEKLSDKQWDDYQKLAGTLTRQYIREVLQGGDWKAMSKDEQKDAIDDAKKDARAEARSQLFGDLAEGDDEDN